MTRTLDFHFLVLRNGAIFDELQPIKNATPLLYMNESSEIKTSLTGDFAENSQVNWLTDQIRPEIEIDGIRHPLGIFLPATVTPTEDENTKSVHLEAYDRCWLVRDNYTETIRHFSAGSNYVEIVRQLLTECGIAVMLVTPSTATLVEDREDWNVGTSLLQIVNDLLKEINYNPLWFNAQGAAIVAPARAPSVENIQHTLDSSQVTSLMLPQIRQETDVYQAPNVFICIVSNADKSGPLVATAENNNPQSPLSIPRRGRRIVSVQRLDNVASQADLEAHATKLRNESLFTGETITVRTALLPGFGVDDITALHYGEISALCVERAWSMELRVGGSMMHKLERVVIALD